MNEKALNHPFSFAQDDHDMLIDGIQLSPGMEKYMCFIH